MPAALIAPTRTPVERPMTLRWTREQFHRFGDEGMFEGRRAMLIDGEILEEGPMDAPHATGITKTLAVLYPLFSNDPHVRVQLPFDIGSDNDPHPDLAVVPGQHEDYEVDHPTKAVLIIEIADSSVRFDTGKKAELYAGADIPEYWVVDVLNRKVFAFRNPVDGDYTELREYAPGESLAPLAAAASPIAVARMLPR